MRERDMRERDMREREARDAHHHRDSFIRASHARGVPPPPAGAGSAPGSLPDQRLPPTGDWVTGVPRHPGDRGPWQR